MNWQAVSAIATSITAVIIFISVIGVYWQLREFKRASYAQAFFVAIQRLQEQKFREARGEIFALRDSPYLDWSSEKTLTAQIVCSNYDVIGILFRNKMLPKRMVLDCGGDNSLLRLWTILEPLIKKTRRERNAPEFWDDMEYMYKLALKYHKRNHRKAKIKDFFCRRKSHSQISSQDSTQ